MRLKQFLFIFLGFTSITAQASGVKPTLLQIGQLAEKHIVSLLPAVEIGEREIRAAKLDPRIQVQRCESPLQASVQKLEDDSRYVNVMISCPNTTWTLYVPVKIRHLVPTIVAARTLDKGTLLGQGDLVIELKEKHLVRHGAQQDIEKYYGAKTKRRISTGQILNASKICLVCKGETVTITASVNGLVLKTEGAAMSDGGIGELIRVKNTASGRLVDARVGGVGQVEINL